MVSLIIATIVVTYALLSVVYTNVNFIYIFICLIPILFWIYYRSRYYKLLKFAVDETYFEFQFKRSIIYLIPTVIVLVAIFIFPTDYRSFTVMEQVNETADIIIEEVEVLDRLSSRFRRIDSEIESLGGDLQQQDTIRFKAKTNLSSVFLTTGIYDRYTGHSFLSAEEETISDFSEDTSIFADSFIRGSSTYTLEIVNYNSRNVPIAKNYTEIVDSEDNFTKNEFGEVFYNNYFIEGDLLTVKYNVMDYAHIGNQIFLNDNTVDIIPVDALSPLPDTISQRTKDLANNIWENTLEMTNHVDYFSFISPNTSESEYNKIISDFEVNMYIWEQYAYATFVNNYLLSQFEYTTTPGEIVGDDFVDSFLFELKEGYCTSFASAMYVLMRARDIPCRYLTGYVVEASGNNFVNVTDRSKHAWVEVYLEGIGYVPFDPTPPIYQSYYSGAISESQINSLATTNSNNTPVTPEPTATPVPTVEPTPVPTPNEEELETPQVSEEVAEESFFELNPWVLTLIIIVISSLIALLAIYFSILIYIKYKEKMINKILSSKDIDIVYKSLINQLTQIRLTQKSEESLREFMRRVYKFDRPFGVDNVLSALYIKHKQDTIYDEFTPHLSKEMEEVITILESHLYSDDKYDGDISVLIEFRDRINKLIYETRNYFEYLSTFKKVSE